MWMTVTMATAIETLSPVYFIDILQPMKPTVSQHPLAITHWDQYHKQTRLFMTTFTRTTFMSDGDTVTYLLTVTL